MTKVVDLCRKREDAPKTSVVPLYNLTLRLSAEQLASPKKIYNENLNINAKSPKEVKNN